MAKVNGEAIYGTRLPAAIASGPPESVRSRATSDPGELQRDGHGGPVAAGREAVKQVFFTKKPDALYAITAGWPGKRLVLRNVKVPADGTVTMLGHEGKLVTRLTART